VSDVLQWCQPREAISGEIADELLEKQIVNNANSRHPSLTVDLICQAKSELVKGKQMHIEQHTVPLSAKKPFDAVE
jgi:hypothetical protein